MVPSLHSGGLDDASPRKHCTCHHLPSFARPGSVLSTLPRSKCEKLKHQLFQISFLPPFPNCPLGSTPSAIHSVSSLHSSQPSFYLLSCEWLTSLTTTRSSQRARALSIFTPTTDPGPTLINISSCLHWVHFLNSIRAPLVSLRALYQRLATEAAGWGLYVHFMDVGALPERSFLI